MKNSATILCVLLSTTALSALSQPTYCSAKGGSSISSKYTLYSSSGNALIDQLTNAELMLLQNSFLVYPVFFFYDDSDGKNAKATDEVTVANGPDGTVIFGKRLFNSEAIRSYGGTTIPIIAAHEYAHIVDFKYGVLEYAPPMQREIFADVFAGMYIYVRSMFGFYTNTGAVLECFEGFGDTDFGSDDHHGTPKQRADAVQHGLDFMQSQARSGIMVNLHMAIQEAKEYSSQFGN